MADIKLTYRYPDGTKAKVEIYVDDSFPDCLDEARAQAVRALKQIVGEDAQVDEG